MKKIKNILALLVVALMGLSLAACGNDDLDTNQYQDGVHLNVYGPQPVMRGGQLRFLGSNLDQIAQVKIPGCEPITNIEVIQAGNPSEIRVTVPKDGPEEGYVTLVTKTDEEITTKTKLTYKESIVIDTLAPESVMPGETLTIKGDYLNLVHMVVFAENVRVSENDFVSHDRYKIEVVVPEEARTGKVSLLDADLSVDDASGVTYNIITSEKALNVGTPTITKWSSPRGEAEQTGNVTAKKGEKITVTGQHFGLVDNIKFESETSVTGSTDFTVSADGKTLTLSLPEDAPDGEFKLVTRSGVEIPVGTLTTVKPSGCVASPKPVKAGAALTITGKDLDLVSSIEMPNVEGEISFTVNADGTKVTIANVPASAQEGNLVLRMENNSGVEVPFTLVKPAVTSYTTANAGGVVTFTGTNLDLVKAVQFGEGSDVAVATTASDGKSLTVTIPMNAKSGKPTLNLINGSTLEAPELQISEALFCYVTALPTDTDPEAGKTYTVPVKNGDKLQKVYFNGTEVAYIYTEGASTVTFNIPASIKASSTVKFESSNGSYEFTLTFPLEQDLAKLIKGMDGNDIAYPFTFTWNDAGRFFITADVLKSLGVKKGSTLLFYKEKSKTGQIQINSAASGWPNITSIADWSGEYEVLSQEFDDKMMEAFNDGLAIQGDLSGVTKIAILP